MDYVIAPVKRLSLECRSASTALHVSFFSADVVGKEGVLLMTSDGGALALGSVPIQGCPTADWA